MRYRTLDEVPVSAPKWAWLTYYSALALLAVIAALVGGEWAAVCVVVAAAISYQFWYRAVWRGLRESG